MKLNEDILLYIVKNIGLKLHLPQVGISHGYTVLLAQFSCQEKEDEFFESIQLLRKFAKPFRSKKKLREALANPIKPEVKKVIVFMKHLWAYHAPEDFEDFFKQRHNQNEIEVTSKKLSKIESKEIVHKPLVEVFKEAYMFSKAELRNHLEDLAGKLQQFSHPYAIIASAENHTLNLKYDPDSRKWFNRDAKGLRKAKSHKKQYSSAELADTLFDSLGDAGEYTGYTLRVLSRKGFVEKMRPALQDLAQTQETLAEQIPRRNANKLNLMHISLRTRCSRTFCKVLESTEIDPNELDETGVAPLRGACLSNDIVALRALLAREDIDPLLSDENGETALGSAIGLHFVDGVEALLKHYTIADLKRKNINGLSIADIANGKLLLPNDGKKKKKPDPRDIQIVELINAHIKLLNAPKPPPSSVRFQGREIHPPPSTLWLAFGVAATSLAIAVLFCALGYVLASVIPIVAGCGFFFHRYAENRRNRTLYDLISTFPESPQPA